MNMYRQREIYNQAMCFASETDQPAVSFTL